MKNTSLWFGTMIFGLIFSACSPSRFVDSFNTRQDDTTVYEVTNPSSLADLLVRLPGVYVDESIRGKRVTIRGRQPLFVVDGMPVGNSYASAESAVNLYDIASVEVLKNPSETVAYGNRGQNGVIVIHTKRGD